MSEVGRGHFERAAADIAAHGDNDTLPFDIDNRFLSDRQAEVTDLAYDFYQQLQRDTVANSRQRLAAVSVFSERLLAPAGPAGFRVSTKIQPFWNLYFNGLGVAIADAFEKRRDDRVHSYRFLDEGGGELFNRDRSWRLVSRIKCNTL
jgi:hypothetical protein